MVRSKASPIGIFDSGLGGLTVTAAIAARLPNERLVYLGDTARVPYGTRSPETVRRYAQACAAQLRPCGMKLLVVACNTVSAVALEMLRAELDIPVLGVIEPGARAGVRATKAGKVGILATAGTVASAAYERAVDAQNRRVQVVSQPAPLLVPLAEEGWLTGPVPELVVAHYLEVFRNTGVDVLVLGCTHYPLLRNVIEQVTRVVLGPGALVVDSADATADELVRVLRERDLVADAVQPGDLELRVTDVPGRFKEVACRFLGQPISPDRVRQVDL